VRERFGVEYTLAGLCVLLHRHGLLAKTGLDLALP
jgi:hypothetical protein